MATIKDVAAETGLTVSTVSRVLNNRGYISDKTRKKVYDAMNKLNYTPNEVARSLSKKTNNTIGVIVPHIRHPYFSELISNLEMAAYEKNYKIFIFNSREKQEKENEYLEMCYSNRVAGVIMCSGSVHLNVFDGLNIPIVTIERFLENGTAGVECDNIQGGRLAAKHLIDLGCRHLIHISGVHETMMPADDRATGFCEICEREGVDHKIVETSASQYNTLDYHQILKVMLEKNPETDGVFASSDLIAAQFLQICHAMSIAVPDDIKVVGFDDSYIASVTTPQITTIHQPIKEMAQKAIECLVDSVEGKIVPTRTTLPVRLVVRGTTDSDKF